MHERVDGYELGKQLRLVVSNLAKSQLVPEVAYSDCACETESACAPSEEIVNEGKDGTVRVRPW